MARLIPAQPAPLEGVALDSLHHFATSRISPARVAAHVSFWVVYTILNPIVSILLQQGKLGEDLPKFITGEAFTLPFKIGLTYFVFYYIIPLYLDRSKVLKLVGLTILGFAVTTLLYRAFMVGVIFPWLHPGGQIRMFSWPGFLLMAFDLFITVAAASTFKMVRLHYKSRDFEQQLVREKLQSELSFLRAQTNPHFLFNTLNNLYVLARKKSDLTPDAIMMLSKIMRFLLYECRSPRIAVSGEARVIADYIELEKLRYNDRLRVRYTEDLDRPDAAIAPLLLLPFVENSFKHGASATTGEVEINIDLQLQDGHLIFTVENTVDPDHEISTGAGGIGLKNVRRQLELLYPQQHELAVGRQNGQYRVRLEIDLSARR